MFIRTLARTIRRQPPVQRTTVRATATLLRLLQPHERRLGYRLTFSQCGEDSLIEFLFTWLGISNPFYLDLGASHPYSLSNTARLALKGSRGVCVEPDADLAALLRAARPNATVLNAGVGFGHTEEKAEFYVMAPRVLSTFSKEEAERYASYGRAKIEAVRTIPLLPVATILARHCVRPPNFVSLDIEGWDLAVLRSWDFTRWRPAVVVVESMPYTENNSETKDTVLLAYMREQGYLVLGDTYLNSVFVDEAAWAHRVMRSKPAPSPSS